ncbi:s-isoprenylcysteine O-methyltransferase [Trichoderma cornu-damae]|uniref:Protein-S-isoprenylcysteine O-methyltransferase n=1 Tax=Trichoderma cornu-damae TaxID=654480 RepID=A0A9P8QQS8_9HYPO|nr:s-isoprenylcysteine O-methyltransferase [Trichoderma cornu-damae]
MATSFTPQPRHHDDLPPFLSDPGRNGPLQRQADNPLRPFFPGQPKSLSGIAIRAFCLGNAFAASLVGVAAVLLFTNSPIWRVPFFVLALSAFHFLEFWTTAERNTAVASVDSFLLTANWPAYAVAHSAAFIECIVVTVFFPARSWAPFGSGRVLLLVGLSMVLVGQAVRSLAMLHAGASFNHHIQTKKAQSHLLVTTGIYGWMRHPSYFGFFYWGLGTQLVLGNALCFVAYSAVLYMFFKARIGIEEEKLVEFFGGDYVEYRKRVGTLIPFIR